MKAFDWIWDILVWIAKRLGFASLTYIGLTAAISLGLSELMEVIKPFYAFAGDAFETFGGDVILAMNITALKLKVVMKSTVLFK